MTRNRLHAHIAKNSDKVSKAVAYRYDSIFVYSSHSLLMVQLAAHLTVIALLYLVHQKVPGSSPGQETFLFVVSPQLSILVGFSA